MSTTPPRRSFVAAAAVVVTLGSAGCGAPAVPGPAPVAPAPTFAAREQVTCDEAAYSTQDPTTSAWRHPSQNYYEPGQRDLPTDVDLRHLLVNDAAAIVRYRADAPAAERAALRDWAGTRASIVVVPAQSDAPTQLEAFTANRHLSCDGVDTEQLSAFADRRGSLVVAPHGSTGGS